MKLDASPSSPILRNLLGARRFTALKTGACLLLLGTACSSSDEPGSDPVRPRESEATPNPSPNPQPSTPATGTPTANDEATPTPAFDGTGSGASAPGAAQAADAGVATSSPDAGSAPIAEPGDAGAPSSTDPTQDENLVFILEDGFQTTYFASTCRSLGEDGSIIEGVTGGTLPVGGGFILECSLESLPSRATTDVLSASDEPWCALGELTTYVGAGDERLTVNVVTPPDISPAVLIATTDGEQIELTQAAVFGAPIWPVWVEAVYDVNEVAPAQQGRLCDEIFGL